ncbi:MAG: hypothetical protein AAGF92_14940 [Myxococcota bacterium]
MTAVDQVLQALSKEQRNWVIDERIKAYGRELAAAGRAIISALAVTGLYVFSAKPGRVDLFDVMYLLLLATTGFGFVMFYQARVHRKFLRGAHVREAILREVDETHLRILPTVAALVWVEGLAAYLWASGSWDGEQSLWIAFIGVANLLWIRSLRRAA